MPSIAKLFSKHCEADMNDLPSDEKKKDTKGAQKNNLKSFLSRCSKKKPIVAGTREITKIIAVVQSGPRPF